MPRYEKTYVNGTYSKRITVIGSSVAYGTGATGNNGYLRRLATALSASPYNFTTTNVSIGGNNTTDVINRFYADVTPTNPDIIIVGLSLANEGILGATDKAALCDSYIKNIFKIVEMGLQIGCKVVVSGCYPHNDYTATDYYFLKQTNQILENSSIPYINVLGAVDTGTGHWRTGMFADAGHPNDVGAEAMFRVIPLSLFDRITHGEYLQPISLPQDYILTPGPQTTELISVYRPENDFGSVTAMVNVRRPTGISAGRALLTFVSTGASTAHLRVRNNVDVWALQFGDGATNLIDSTIASSNNKRVNLCIRSNYYTNSYSFFIDGVLIDTVVQDVGIITHIRFGCREDSPSVNAGDYEFSGFAVWRTALSDEQIYDAVNGKYSKASLCLLSPPVDSEIKQNGSLVNLAPSSTTLKFETSNITTIKSPSVTSEATRLEGLINTTNTNLATTNSSLASTNTNLAALTSNGTFTPALNISSGVTYTRQEGWWAKFGDIFHFEIYLSWSAAPSGSTIEIQLPTATIAHPVFFVRYMGTALTSGKAPYAFMNVDSASPNNASTLFVRQRDFGEGTFFDLLATPGGDLKIVGSYRWR